MSHASTCHDPGKHPYQGAISFPTRKKDSENDVGQKIPKDTNIYSFTGKDLAVLSQRMRVCVTGHHDWQQTSSHLGQTFAIDQTLF